MVGAAWAYICRRFDPFYLAQTEYAMSGDDPYYNGIDLFAVPASVNHIRAISDTLPCNSAIEVFPFWVPHKKKKIALDYYSEGTGKLSKRP